MRRTVVLNVAGLTLDLLGDERRLDALRRACGRVRASLSGGATSRAVAAEILALAREIR